MLPQKAKVRSTAVRDEGPTAAEEEEEAEAALLPPLRSRASSSMPKGRLLLKR